MSGKLWPLAVYGGAVILLVLAMLGFSYPLGQRHRGRETGEPYESGIIPTGSARVRFDIKFYLVAMCFVIFDIESVFLYSWAVSLREAGWRGYWAMVVFVAVLLLTLLYLWKSGILRWGSRREDNLKGEN